MASSNTCKACAVIAGSTSEEPPNAACSSGGFRGAGFHDGRAYLVETCRGEAVYQDDDTAEAENAVATAGDDGDLLMTMAGQGFGLRV